MDTPYKHTVTFFEVLYFARFGVNGTDQVRCEKGWQELTRIGTKKDDIIGEVRH